VNRSICRGLPPGVAAAGAMEAVPDLANFGLLETGHSHSGFLLSELLAFDYDQVFVYGFPSDAGTLGPISTHTKGLRT
jgi:hypothetical protein